MNELVAYSRRIPPAVVETVSMNVRTIRQLVRMQSPALTQACERAGLPASIADTCAGLLASVVEDLIAVGNMRRTDFERTKRKERILQAAHEPAASALRLCMLASPLNGRAAVSHWDAICEQHEIGKLAWLLGADTETAYSYGKRISRKNENSR